MVHLPEEADLQLERLARQTKRSKADLLREALDRYLAEQRTAQLPSWVTNRPASLVGGDRLER